MAFHVCNVCGRERMYASHWPYGMCDDCRVSAGYSLGIQNLTGGARLRAYSTFRPVWRKQCRQYRQPCDDSLTGMRVFHAFGRKCCICGVAVTFDNYSKKMIPKWRWATVDHVVPIQYAEYGHEVGNVVLACHTCNLRKHDRRITHLEIPLRQISFEVLGPFILRDNTWSSIRLAGHLEHILRAALVNATKSGK